MKIHKMLLIASISVALFACAQPKAEKLDTLTGGLYEDNPIGEGLDTVDTWLFGDVGKENYDAKRERKKHENALFVRRLCKHPDNYNPILIYQHEDECKKMGYKI